MKFTFITTATLIIGLITFSPMAAAAEYYYNFSLVSADFNGAGIVSSPDQSGDLTLDHASGIINGLVIDGLSRFGDADNIYYGDGSVDFGGISFNTSDGDFYNVFYYGVGHNNGPEYDREFTLSLSPLVSLGSAVPEPATWTMILIGLGMIGFAARRYQGVRARSES